MIDKNYPKKDIAVFWNEHKEDYADALGYLKVYYHYYKDKAGFTQATTENIMDYNSYSENDIITRTNPHKKTSFWKFQWEIMQSEIKSYYNS